MKFILQVSQLVVSVVLVLLIMVQSRSTGLSSTFGGSGTINSSKRGAEKVVFQATIVFAVLFVALSLAFVFVR